MDPSLLTDDELEQRSLVVVPEGGGQAIIIDQKRYGELAARIEAGDGPIVEDVNEP